MVFYHPSFFHRIVLFSSFFVWSTKAPVLFEFTSSLFYFHLWLISHVQQSATSLHMWQFVFVSSSFLPSFLFFIFVSKTKTAQGNEKELLCLVSFLPFLSSLSPILVHTHYNSVLDNSLCHIKNTFLDHKQLICLPPHHPGILNKISAYFCNCHWIFDCNSIVQLWS